MTPFKYGHFRYQFVKPSGHGISFRPSVSEVMPSGSPAWNSAEFSGSKKPCGISVMAQGKNSSHQCCWELGRRCLKPMWNFHRLHADYFLLWVNAQVAMGNFTILMVFTRKDWDFPWRFLRLPECIIQQKIGAFKMGPYQL